MANAMAICGLRRPFTGSLILTIMDRREKRKKRLVSVMMSKAAENTSILIVKLIMLKSSWRTTPSTTFVLRLRYSGAGKVVVTKLKL
ncbi:hypothetical protein Lal_00047922 [Lupinus albus]|nr:hypothetical protein Lal_00047922 [Lupinus albus]